jgi:hypothetical protein
VQSIASSIEFSIPFYQNFIEVSEPFSGQMTVINHTISTYFQQQEKTDEGMINANFCCCDTAAEWY